MLYGFRCGKNFRLFDVPLEGHDIGRMPVHELVAYYYLHKHRRLLWRRSHVPDFESSRPETGRQTAVLVSHEGSLPQFRAPHHDGEFISLMMTELYVCSGPILVVQEPSRQSLHNVSRYVTQCVQYKHLKQAQVID